MTTASAILDISALVLLIICTIYYAKKGFVGGVLGLLGSIAAILASYLIARHAAPAVFDAFIRPGLESRITQALAEQTALTVQSMQAALQDILAFLPDYAVAGVVNAFEYSQAGDPAAFAAGMVTDLIAPLIIPVIVLVLFVIVFLLLRILFGALNIALNRIARLPLLGTANTALGAAMGVFVAGVYIFLAVALLKGAAAVLPGTADFAEAVRPSIFFRLFSGLLLLGF